VVAVEHPGWADGLRARGHTVEVVGREGAHGFGHAHLLATNPSGGWSGGSDSRAVIGAAAGY
jgi:hypothetical protein